MRGAGDGAGGRGGHGGGRADRARQRQAVPAQAHRRRAAPLFIWCLSWPRPQPHVPDRHKQWGEVHHGGVLCTHRSRTTRWAAGGIQCSHLADPGTMAWRRVNLGLMQECLVLTSVAGAGGASGGRWRHLRVCAPDWHDEEGCVTGVWGAWLVGASCGDASVVLHVVMSAAALCLNQLPSQLITAPSA